MSSSSPAADAAAARRAKILAKSAERMSLVKGELTQSSDALPSPALTLTKKSETVTNEVQQPVPALIEGQGANPEIVENEKANQNSSVAEKKKVEKPDARDEVATDGLRRRGHAVAEVLRSDERASAVAPVVTKSAEASIKTNTKTSSISSSSSSSSIGGVGVLSEAARVLRRHQQIDSVEAVLLAGFPVVLGFACAAAWNSCGLISQHSYFLQSSDDIAREDDTRLVASRKLFGAESMLMTPLDEGRFLEDEGGTEDYEKIAPLSSPSLTTDSILLLVCSHISKRAPFNAPLALIAVCIGRAIITSIFSLVKKCLATATNSITKDVLSTVQAEQNGASQAGMLGMLAGALKYGNVAMKWYRYGKSVFVDVSILVVSWIILASILSLFSLTQQ